MKLNTRELSSVLNLVDINFVRSEIQVMRQDADLWSDYRILLLDWLNCKRLGNKKYSQ